MIDTHCHLGSSRFRKDRAEVMARARQAGVEHFVEVAYDLSTSERCIALARENEDMWASVGMHPHEVAKANNRGRVDVESLAAEDRTVGGHDVGLLLEHEHDGPPRREHRERNLGGVQHERPTHDESLRVAARITSV